MKKLFCWFCLFVTCLSINNLFSEETPSPKPPEVLAPAPSSEKEKPKEEEPKDSIEVVVTATRTEEKVEKTASSITFIDRQEIDAKHYTTTAQALESVPGTEIVRNGTPGQATSIFIRGTESNHTAFFVDDRRLQENILGGYDLANLDLANVQRIEVLRGPASTLYGAEGIGGVVNIIPESGKGLKEPESSFSFEGGSFRTFKEAVASRGAYGPFDYAVGATRFDADYPRPNHEYSLNAMNTHVGYQAAKDVYIDGLFLYSLADTGVPGDFRFGNNLHNHLLIENWLVSPGITWQTTDFWKQRAFISYAPERVHANEPDFGNNDRTQIDQTQIEYQNNFQIAHNWKIVAGMTMLDSQVYRDSFGIQNIGVASTSEGGFLQSQWEIVKDWNLLNSVRYDGYSDFDDRATWKIGSSYRTPVTETLLHANYGTAYAPPTPGDLFFPPFFGFPTANPNLVPEESAGWEAGLEQPFLEDKLAVSATYFSNDIHNLIQLDENFIPQNLSKAETSGVELGLRYDILSNLNLNVNYTYLEAIDKGTGLRLIRRPRNKICGAMTYHPIEVVSLSFGCDFINARQDGANVPIEDYLVMRLAATWDVNPHLQIFSRVENLTNEHYEETLGFPALGMGAYGGFKVTF